VLEGDDVGVVNFIDIVDADPLDAIDSERKVKGVHDNPCLKGLNWLEGGKYPNLKSTKY
jgi:hypothetical protein